MDAFLYTDKPEETLVFYLTIKSNAAVSTQKLKIKLHLDLEETVPLIYRHFRSKLVH